MILCFLYESSLAELAQGKLPTAQATRVQAHIAGCARCRARLESYQAALALFAGAEAPTLSGNYLELSRRIATETTLAPRRNRALVPVSLAALGLAGIAFFVTRPKTTENSHGPVQVGSIERPVPSIGNPTPPPLLPKPSASPVQQGRQFVSERPINRRLSSVPPSVPAPSPMLPTQHRIANRDITRIMRDPTITTPSKDDLQFLNPPAVDQTARQREEALLRSVAGGDDFITVSVPPIAAANENGNRAALEAMQREQAVVDARLVRPMTIAAKSMPFSDLCAQLTKETGITFTANRRVTDDEVTLYCTNRPLREVMRQLARHFGFEWHRTGTEPEFEYELTQSLGRQLYEETLRQQDRDAMLVQIEDGVKTLQKLFELTPEQQEARMKELDPQLKDNPAAFEEWSHLYLLKQGGQTVLPRFLQLSPEELGQLRSGATYQWDLMPDGKLPDSVRRQAEFAFLDPSGKPLVPGPITALSGTLQLERKEGKWTLRGGFQRNGTGLGLPLASATSPALEKIDNAARNKAIARNPELQGQLSLQVAATCQLKRHPYPEFDEFTEGPYIIAADALEAFHKATGKDVIGDQFLRLSTPIHLEKKTLFQVLCSVGDNLRLHAGQSEGWFTFRTPDFYTARLQQVPQRQRTRWAETRRKTGKLSIHELAEMGSLPAACLDSSLVAQTLLARYGLEEWPLLRSERTRPHWNFLEQLTPEQREQVESDAGLAYTDLRPKLRTAFIDLLELSPERTGPPSLKNARVWMFRGEKARKLLPNPGVTFVYRYDDPGTYNALSPFNGMFGLYEEMYQSRLAKTQ
ncbi:MAG: hypothetical protein QM758_16940 [Armatimonas sp.]